MSSVIIVVLVGLFSGYWIVSKIISHNKSYKDAGAKFNDSKSSNKKESAWHEVLNVSESATFEEIHTSYKKLIGQYHPDRVAPLGLELRELAEKKFKEINAAYELAQKLKSR